MARIRDYHTVIPRERKRVGESEKYEYKQAKLYMI